MKKQIFSMVLALCIAICSFPAVFAAEGKAPKYQTQARQMERLNRGLIAVRTYDAPNNGITGGVYLSWRLLGDESLTNQAFDIYRNGVKIHTTGAHDATNYTDTKGTENDVYKVVKKGASAAQVLAETGVSAFKEHNKTARGSFAANGTSEKNSFTYVDIPLVRPADVKNHGGGTSTYHTGGGEGGGSNDASVGDLDGDGDYEIVLKWNPSDAKDSASGGYTGNVYIDAYEISENNGGYMWRIDLGKNIRAGAHYTQFMVYDLDGDGKSEVAMKTAPGSIDGTGRFVTEVGDSEAIRNADNSAIHLSGKGIPTSGGEYLTIFDGETGRALYTTDYIPRGNVGDWGDSKYNRSERYLAAVAYLDGKKPSLIMCRGYYAKAVVRAYDWNGSELELLWEHNGTKKAADSLYGQGNHNLSVADIDNDGRDEIVYGSAALDDNGKAIGNTFLGHGDAMHVSDFNNDGVQEVFSVKEDDAFYKTNAEDFRVAATGKNLYKIPGGGDNGRGVMANIDDAYADSHPNALAMGWSVADGNAHDLTGAAVNAKPSASSRIMTNFLVYWDGDLGRELLDDTLLAKYHADTGWTIRFYNDGSGYSLPASSNNGSKQNPALVADLWGDWREEIIMPIGQGQNDTPYLRIFTSTLPTKYRLTTLMHDCQYRLAIAWQNVAYNQPPHQSYYIGSAALATDAAGNRLNYLAPEVPFTKVQYAETVAVEGISLSENSITVKEGSSYALSANIRPNNATMKGVSWESDNEEVAKVINGNVTGVGSGSCVITATTRDGGFTAQCEVTVLPVKTVDVLDEGIFVTTNTDKETSFTGNRDSAYFDQTGSTANGEFYRDFTPFYSDVARLSFTFNTGGKKNGNDAWNWDGREYTFGLAFLDSSGGNILTLSQSYRSSAQKTMSIIGSEKAGEVGSSWTAAGTGQQNPLNRSSTTWYVTMEFNYDENICTAKIMGSDKDIEYTKSFPLNGKSFGRLRYYTSVDGSGGITVGPYLTDLSYTLTLADADPSLSLLCAAGKTAEFGINGGTGAAVVIGALYSPAGELVEIKTAECENVVSAKSTVEFEREIEGYRLRLFMWKDTKSLAPLSAKYDSEGVIKRLPIKAVTASHQPEAAHPAEHSCDGDTGTYWTSQGKQNIVYDMGEKHTLTGVRAAFRKYDDNRIIPFSVYVSEDGENWTAVHFGNSVPFSGDFINIPAAQNARYVKLETEGNSISGWTSLSEVQIYGI